MLKCGTITGEKNAFQHQQRGTSGCFEQRGDGGGRGDGMRHLDGLVHRQCVGVGDQADEGFGRQSLLPIRWHVARQRARDVDHRMGIRLTIRLAQHPDAQRACVMVQAEGVGDMRQAFGFDGVEDDGARGEAVEDQVVARGQHPCAGALRPGDDEGAATTIAFDDPIGDKHVECCPDREAADVELLHEVFVGRNLIAHAPVALGEAGAQGLEDLEVGWKAHGRRVFWRIVRTNSRLTASAAAGAAGCYRSRLNRGGGSAP